MSRRTRRLAAIGLIVCLILSLVPESLTYKARAASDDLEIKFGAGTTIGNMSYAADNAFINFYNNQTPGFYQTQKASNAIIDWSRGDVFAGTDDEWATVRFKINIAENPALRDLALSGQAELLTGFSVLRYHSGFLWTRISTMYVKLDGKVVLEARTNGGNVYNKSASAIIKPTSVIEVEVVGEGEDDGEGAGIRGFYLKFQDKQRPVISNYTFTGTGNERENGTINQQELYVKENENITLTYNFSEPVKPNDPSMGQNDYFFRHPLFVNPAGTGLPAAGQQQYLQNITYSAANRGTYQKNIAYQYTGVRYHNSGNLPLEPKITGTTPGYAPIDQTLQEKFNNAVLADGAGNVAKISLPGVGSPSSNVHVRGDNVNPFDYRNGGYRVIVDAVRPKYTKVGNGIQPEILTGVTLNKGDIIDFTVQMTEEAMINKGWDINKTFLYFNNGMKAYYTGGANSKNWTFRATVTGSTSFETPLLKVISLSNDAKQPGDSDLYVVSDYAGNLLIQPANYDGVHEDGDISNVNSKIDWANLSIDNTKPLIGYHYELGGASDTTYRKEGKITIDANDPAIQVPQLDPDLNERGKTKPSKGIYRPTNMSGEASPSVGLVYYWWSKDPADPFASKAEDHNAALKRFALTAKQPSEELYPGELTDVKLRVANNKTNLLAPPPEALMPENSGEWYLHTWTADMTWDSARELTQYEKMKNYVRVNDQQYEAWKAELPGASEADQIAYADSKALAAVGRYDDLNEWKAEDFKHDDSNWTHNVGVLRLDNEEPVIVTGESSGENSADVRLTALVTDRHSGIGSVQYQWVKEGEGPTDLNWKPAEVTGNALTFSTLNEVFEYGSFKLYLKVADHAGNETVQALDKPAVVGGQSSLPGQFDPEANPDYAASHDVTFLLSGIVPDFVGYAISTSAIHPADESAYTALDSGEEPSAEPSPIPTPSTPVSENGPVTSPTPEASPGWVEPSPTPGPSGETDEASPTPGTDEASPTPEASGGSGEAPSPSQGASGGAATPVPPDESPVPDNSGAGAVGAGAGLTLLSAAGDRSGPAPDASASPEASDTAPNEGEASDDPTPTPTPTASAGETPGTASPDASGAPGPQASPTAGPEENALLNASAAETLSYSIPADTTISGIQYVHVLVKKDGNSYYYAKAYYWDNEPSEITFSKTGVAYPLKSQDVTVTVAEPYSRNGLVAKYQWVRVVDGAELLTPVQGAGDWLPLPNEGKVTIDGSGLEGGETADYRLYVWAVDGAGNSAVAHTPDTFKVSKPGDEAVPPSNSASDLIYLYGDAEDGYTAIVKLSLETEDKAGYEYSVSPDNGETWVRWRPYTNFVSLKVPSGNPAELQVQVKYRTPGGAISAAFPLSSEGLSLDEPPVYALASVNSSAAVSPTVGADIDIEVPVGYRVIVGEVNPSKPVRSGNSFNVKENGFYSFEVLDLGNPDRKDMLYIVVKNVDSTPPQGTVEYVVTSKTNRNVPVMLTTDEPATIINNNGRNVYTFTENGTFTFEFKDAAGNIGTAEASVQNIDKEVPKVELVSSYTNGSGAFGTITDGNGNVLYASGVTLEVRKADPSAKDFYVRNGPGAVKLLENGTVSFVVEDAYGNTTVLKREVDNILSAPPQAEKVAYTFVDESGEPLPENRIVTVNGKKYAKGKVKATITGKTVPANLVFSGMTPIMEGGAYTNKISGADGSFTYSRLYGTNGTTVIGLSDLLGHTSRIPVTVQGLDNTAPSLTLKFPSTGIVQNKKDFDFSKDLGGYTVSDNVSAADKIQVSVSGLDLTKTGRQRVTYTAKDQVGNIAVAYQDVSVVKEGGLLIFGNDVLVSSSSGETALFDTNTITFRVSGYNLMKVGGENMTNQWGTFDLLYQSGLYREGQLKTIAEKVTYDELVSGKYKVEFPKAGWYTIIVRTQERDREYATFFIGSMD